jgi:tripartite-type tricarboxylate transporter receptor subunit TctC
VNRSVDRMVKRLSAAGFALCATFFGLTSMAQSWAPTKPVKLIVTYAPGGSADVLARLLQEPLTKSLGQAVVVENRAGGGGNVGSQFIARAEPDGHTIGIGAVSTHAINPALFREKLPFRVPQDFTSIGQILFQPNVVLVHPSVPARSVPEFIAWLKQNPGTPFGSAGIGSSNHLTGELVNMRYGVNLQHAPYKSGGLALQDLMAGHIKVVVDNITTAARLAKDGKAHAIAVSTARRSSILPDTPTFAEAGAPGFDLGSWQGLFGPAGLPKPIVDRWQAAMRAALADPIVRERLAGFGAEIAPSSPEEFSAFIVSELKKWEEIVRVSGAKPE